MRGERYICWHIGCRNTDLLLYWSRGVSLYGLGCRSEINNAGFDFATAKKQNQGEEVTTVMKRVSMVFILRRQAGGIKRIVSKHCR